MKLFDTSPLIAILGNLASPGILKHLVSLNYKLYVPTRVLNEVTGSPENENLKAVVASNTVTRLNEISEDEVAKFRNRYPGLGKGESELIIIACKWQKEQRKFCCIIDDANARKAAERLGLKCKGTVGLLQKLKANNLIDQKELDDHYKKLEASGFRYTFKSSGNN